MTKHIENIFGDLRQYCEKEEFKGWDPYDGLNSRLFQSIPLIRNNRYAKLAWIQFFKRSPVNFRKLALVPKEHNPKALGLFLSGYCRMYRSEPHQELLDRINKLVAMILQSGSKGFSGYCWGYNFDWQARAFFQPRYTPTVVATSFVANALLDAYEITGDAALLEAARSSCDFILKDLHRTPDEYGGFCFSYSPLDTSVVFNASLLGSRLLARVYHFTGEEELRTAAAASVAFCCRQQQASGAWAYGFLHFHQWVDNFHTGYNLECIHDYMLYCKDDRYKEVLAKGFAYYRNTFFTAEGIPKYYNDRMYPVDVHTTAQMIVTFSKLGYFSEGREEVDRVLDWTIRNMRSSKGYFYFQHNRFISSKTPYMRWAQGWMFYALAVYLNSEK